MKLAPWNPVRITPNPIAFRCTHCGASDGPRRDMTVMGFMRKLRAFEKTHNRCAPAARRANVEQVVVAVIQKAKRTAATT
jgi:hypothetical protein